MRKRVLLTTLVVSALLLAALVGFALSTVDESGRIVGGREGFRWECRVFRGKIHLMVETAPEGLFYGVESGWEAADQAEKAIASLDATAGIRRDLFVADYLTGARYAKSAFTCLRFSVAWPIALLLTLMVICAIPLRRRGRTVTTHCCPKCGFDLRESHLRCGECGWRMPYEMSFLLALQSATRAAAARRAKARSAKGASRGRTNSRAG
jgi:hypothetical protein